MEDVQKIVGKPVTALTFKAVSGGYRRMPVFHDISFSIREGEMAALIGPNGSGKTTLLRAATGLLEKVEGRVSLFGRDVHKMSPVQRAGLIGVVPQESFTPMAYSVEEIVAMGRTYTQSRWKGMTRDDFAIVEEAMVTTDVIDMRRRAFPELSGGERQRVIIAMVLAQQPRLIVMDEATAHLDINHRMEIMELVEKLNREPGRTILMVSHDLNMAAEYFQRLLLIDRGRLVKDGTPQEVLTEIMFKEVYHCTVQIEKNPHSGAVMVLADKRETQADLGVEG